VSEGFRDRLARPEVAGLCAQTVCDALLEACVSPGDAGIPAAHLPCAVRVHGTDDDGDDNAADDDEDDGAAGLGPVWHPFKRNSTKTPYCRGSNWFLACLLV